uniref:C1q and TNF related 8 n=1 Tax=Microcebus murinus TaxID=30608 RepID=A0A8C6EEP4_MICMU
MAASTLMLLALALPTAAWPGLGLPRRPCVHCCRPAWPPASPGPYAHVSARDPWWGLPRVRPTIDISILKGGCPRACGLRDQGAEEGLGGSRDTERQSPLARAYAAFSVGRREGLHSGEDLQAVPFDTELVNLDGAFDLASGRFRCAVPGVYFLSLNVHTWNHKETYLHVMLNRRPTAVLYAQPSERSVMQAQSLLLPLAAGDTVWVRMFRRDRDNAIYGERGDLYITFSGHLVKPDAEL